MSLSRLLLPLLLSFEAAFALDLSGRVLNADSTGLAGVSVRLASSGALALTDASGAWRLSATQGISRSAGLERSVSRHLVVRDGRLRLAFQGHDVAGRNAAWAAFRWAGVGAPAARGAAGPDTLVYSKDETVFLRDTVSVARSGMVRLYDSTWNPDIVYGWLDDVRDGKLYRTVSIGSQTWMAQNLNFKVDSSWFYIGTDQSLPFHSSGFDSTDDSRSGGARFGRLYTWSVALGLPASCNLAFCSTSVAASSRGLCPEGWHVPSAGEWDTLFRTVKSDPQVGAKRAAQALMATSGWNSMNGVGGQDRSGFRAMAAGCRYSFGETRAGGGGGYWWSRSEVTSRLVANVMFDGRYATENSDSSYKDWGYSVRCLKD